MNDLSITYRAWLDAQEAQRDGGHYIPDDGVCADCSRLIRNHPGVELELASRKMKFWDDQTGTIVVQGSVPYCRCVPRASIG